MAIKTKYKLTITQIIGYTIVMGWAIATQILHKITTIISTRIDKINRETVITTLEEDNLNKLTDNQDKTIISNFRTKKYNLKEDQEITTIIPNFHNRTILLTLLIWVWVGFSETILCKVSLKAWITCLQTLSVVIETFILQIIDMTTNLFMNPKNKKL